MLEDLAVLTNGTVITDELGMKLEAVTLKELGQAGRVEVSKENTIVIDGAGTKEAISERVETIRTEWSTSESDYDKEKLLERIAKLSGGVAVLKVGATTETEMKDKKLRLEDAIKEIINRSEEFNIDTNQIILCGDSAGGALATVGTIMSRDGKVPQVHGQILIYPWVDMTMCRRSMDIKLEGMILNKKTIAYFANHYLNTSEEQVDWRASPLLTSNLSNLPPTYIYGAGLDPLVDEGDAFKRRLLSFGNEVPYRLFPGQMHAFISNSIQLPTSLICIKEMGIAAQNIFSKR